MFGRDAEIERLIQEEMRAMAELPHMRRELRALFQIWASPAVTAGEVLMALRLTLHALRDVERFVAGETP